ncbi:MAG: hypothetical protein Q9167_006176 [Letrouitia subvulpina]
MQPRVSQIALYGFTVSAVLLHASSQGLPLVNKFSTSSANFPTSSPEPVNLLSAQNTDRRGDVCKGDVDTNPSAISSRKEPELLESTLQDDGSHCKFNSTNQFNKTLNYVDIHRIRFPVRGTSTVLYVQFSGITLDTQTLRKLITKTQSLIKTRQFVYGRYAPITRPFDVPYGPPHPLYFKAQAEDERLLSWETLQNTMTGLQKLLIVQRMNQEAHFTIHDQRIQVGSGSIWY